MQTSLDEIFRNRLPPKNNGEETEDGEKQRRTSMEDCRKPDEENAERRVNILPRMEKKVFVGLQFDEDNKKCFAVCAGNFPP